LDVKPSNILIDREGRVKLCDFGISGQLVDSIAKSCEAGCKPYMAPERIHPDQTANGYDIRSDVWSFGITMIELATGEFPYPKWDSVFQLLTYVLKNDPPSVPERLPRPTATAEAVVLDDPVLKPGNWEFSSDFRDFVNQCLRRDFHERPKYQALKSHPFFRRALSDPVNVSQYFTAVLSKIPPNSRLEDLVDMNDW
ncbi:putative Dual specificity mitogen-activated protein kinase kinase, partial [Fasciola hepatica]